MGSCGGGSDKSTTGFRRVGQTGTNRSRGVPSWLTGAMRNNILSSSVSDTIGAKEDSFLSGLLSQDYAQPPSRATLDSLLSVSPTDYTGGTAVRSIAGTDPFSSTYADNISSFFKNVFDEAAAAGQSGPEAVRGGTAHGAMARGQVLEKAALNKFGAITGLQMQQQDRTMNAAQLANAIESARRGGLMGAQNQLGTQWIEGQRTGARGSELLNMKRRVGSDSITSLSDLIAPTQNTTTDNLAGSGTQESSHFGWNAGLNCCFILLEALNGELPWYVRRGRDIFCEPVRVSGYKRMASWLVPQMQKRKWVKALVNKVMVKPFLIHGAWYFNAEGNNPLLGRLMQPICAGWFKVWSALGRRK